MLEVHPVPLPLDATGGRRVFSDQGFGPGDPAEVEKLRRELQDFARANPFLFVQGRGPDDSAGWAELEQLRRDIEELERRLPVIDITDALMRIDERQDELDAIRRARARNRRPRFLGKFALPRWLFDPESESEPDDPGHDPSCLDEQDDCDTDVEEHCPGANMSPEQVMEILERHVQQYQYLFGKYCDLCELYREDDSQEFPVAPLEARPITTFACIEKTRPCFHKIYRLHDKSETTATLRRHEPDKMLQIFSLKLSKIQTRPVNIYGFFAVRDELEPLRNYVFNRSRDNAFTIEPGCKHLSLCSPCRGIYVMDLALFEVDIRIKEEGDESPDKPLFCGYLEISGSMHEVDEKLYGRIRGDEYCLDMEYAFICACTAATVEVFATVSNPSYLTFTVCTSGFSDEKIKLFDNTFCGAKALFRHVIAVKMGNILELCLQLKVNGSSQSCSWSFEPGVYSKAGSKKILPKEYGDFHVKVFWSVR